ncbi:MAG: hypothetical protein ACQEXB_04825 [Bacillota bacterium]
MNEIEGGTRTRVNCLLRIIEADRVIDGLDVAVTSDRLRKDFPDSAKQAEELYEIQGEYKVDTKKVLITVCPNCHAMLHREENGVYLSVE